MEVPNYKDPEYLEKYKIKPLSHPYINFPTFLERLGNIKGKKILDLGCGSGDFSSELAEKGADVIGVDISEDWIKHCEKDHKEVSNLKFQKCDSSDLNYFDDSSFDAVVMNMVFLNHKSQEIFEKTFYEVSRVLKKGGSFLFTDLHPICIMAPEGATEKHGYPEGFSYFSDGTKYTSTVKLSDGSSSIDFVDMHWTLETYSRVINDSGMFIFRIIEPKPVTDDVPDELKNYKQPEYIMFHCKKL